MVSSCTSGYPHHHGARAYAGGPRLRKLNKAIRVSDVFGAAGLLAHSPVAWGKTVPESRSGVYVVALVETLDQACPSVDVQSLPSLERRRWLDGQPVVYIGRATRSLQNRLAQFYRHKYGKRAPHRGGQAIKLLDCNLWVYWATTDDPVEAEAAMIAAFRLEVGALPYANRRR